MNEAADRPQPRYRLTIDLTREEAEDIVGDLPPPDDGTSRALATCRLLDELDEIVKRDEETR